MTLTAPPQARQVSMALPNTRFRHCAQVTWSRRSTGACFRAARLTYKDPGVTGRRGSFPSGPCSTLNDCKKYSTAVEE